MMHLSASKQYLLLEKLGYEVIIPRHEESGRTWLSKGLVRKAQAIINRNIEALAPLVSAETPLIGVEPSAILTFRDEYPDLATDENMEAARTLASHVYLVDEFIANELAKGNISPELFTKEIGALNCTAIASRKRSPRLPRLLKCFLRRKIIPLKQYHQAAAVWRVLLAMKKSITRFPCRSVNWCCSQQYAAWKPKPSLPRPAPVAGTRSKMVPGELRCTRWKYCMKLEEKCGM
jgi:hypothetical protein